MVNICACHFNTGAAVPWSSIASGAEDAYLRGVADGFKFLGSPAFFVFDGEPEAKVGASGTSSDYVAAWRHLVTVFRERGVKNVAFMWVTTAYSFMAESNQTDLVKKLYPGNHFVDWIASDPYNFNNDGAWRSLSYELDAWYRWARAAHPSKPLALAEWGSKEDPNDSGRKAAWLREALDALENHYQQIKAVVYFDEEKHERGIVNDWRIDTGSGTTSLDAFAQVAHAKWFNPSVRR
jgi:beta-mannanase